MIVCVAMARLGNKLGAQSEISADGPSDEREERGGGAEEREEEPEPVTDSTTDDTGRLSEHMPWIKVR